MKSVHMRVCEAHKDLDCSKGCYYVFQQLYILIKKKKMFFSNCILACLNRGKNQFHHMKLLAQFASIIEDKITKKRNNFSSISRQNYFYKIILNDKPVNLIWFVSSTNFSSIHGLLEILPSRIQWMQRIVTRLQSFNTRRKFCAAAVASVWSSTVLLRTKKVKTLVGSHDFTQEES